MARPCGHLRSDLAQGYPGRYEARRHHAAAREEQALANMGSSCTAGPLDLVGRRLVASIHHMPSQLEKLRAVMQAS